MILGFQGEDVYYRETMPSFENVCGGVSLSNSSHICNLVSAIETSTENNILKKSKTAFGVCFELFTIYGNITLR